MSITQILWFQYSLEWRHNERDGISNHQGLDCLLNRLFRRKSKKSSKVRVTGLCQGNSPVTGKFPAQMASNAENVSIWWRHHGKYGATVESRCSAAVSPGALNRKFPPHRRRKDSLILSWGWRCNSTKLYWSLCISWIWLHDIDGHDHYNGVIMSALPSQITSVSIVYSTVCSGANQRKHQSSASLALWREFTGDRWIPRTKGQ